MPPFCAPAPPYLLADPAPEEPEHQEDDARAQMIALLVDALSEAEASAGEQNNTAELASQAYTSLCYDFPIVSTRALEALNSSLKSSLLEVRTPFFPITRKFAAGLRYLISEEFRKQLTVTSESESLDVTEFEARSHHLLTLCASVFILAPAVRLQVAYIDEGASLNDLLASYDACTTDSQEEQIVPESSSVLNDGPDSDFFNMPQEADPEIADASESAKVDDDDSDWEPLDVEASVMNVAKVEESASASEEAKAGWCSLIEKVADLTFLLPKEVINSRVWEELKVTERLIKAVCGLRNLEHTKDGVDGVTVAELYSELLSDHVVGGWNSNTSGFDLVTLIKALLHSIEEFKGKSAPKASTSTNPRKTWELLLLNTIAKLCTKVGGFPIGNDASYNPHTSAERKSVPKESVNSSRPSPHFVGSLWQSAKSTLLFLQEQLDYSIRVADSFIEAEFVLSILCFLVKYAPGNADLGSILVGGGFFRTALSLFIKVGADPHMEVLRQFLLVSMATSPAAAEFAAHMPTFRAAFQTPKFVEGSLTRPYAIIWPLLLRTINSSTSTQSSKITSSQGDIECEAGHMLVTALSRIVKLVEDDTSVYKQSGFLKELAELHWMLLLLAEATTVSSSGSFKLWTRGSSVDKAISRCQVALGAVLVQETQSRSSPIPSLLGNGAKESEISEDSTHEVNKSVPHSSTHENDAPKPKKSVEQMGASKADIVASKTKEILPRMLLVLKQLSSLTKGTREGKID